MHYFRQSLTKTSVSISVIFIRQKKKKKYKVSLLIKKFLLIANDLEKCVT